MTKDLFPFRPIPAGSHHEPCGRATLLGILLLSGLAGTGTGCSPAINSFYVQPETYCPSTSQVSIVWDATGETTVTTDLAGQTFHTSKGAEKVTARPMSVSIEAHRNNRKAGRPTINVAPMPSVRPVVGQTGADCDATSSRTSVISVGPNEYDARSSVAAISNSCTSTDPTDPCPTVTVCHGPDVAHVCASSWHIPPGSSTPVTGVGMTGYWQLARCLQPNETCGSGPSSVTPGTTASGPPPGQHLTHLKVQFTLVCT